MLLISKLTYRVFLSLYYVSVKAASLFDSKAAKWIDGRKESFNKLNQYDELSKAKKRIWFHCASLGEFEQARPLIEKVKEKQPDASIVLSFFSPSGYEPRKDYEIADCVFYLPFDFPSNAGKTIEVIKPDIVFWTKYDFWYYTLQELKINKIPLYLFSANFRESQIFFSPFGIFFKSMLQCFSEIFVQNEKSKTLLSNSGIESVVAGDTRFDRVLQIAASPKRFEKAEQFIAGSKVLLAGSTWPEDEELIREALDLIIVSGFKLIIAPHQTGSIHLQKTKKLFDNSYTLFSSPELQEDKNVMIIDNIGMLSSLYQYADVAYIGGGFGNGIHNILEAAVFGKAILFGPKFQKSEEAKELIQLGAASVITEAPHFIKALKAANDKERVEATRLITEEYFSNKKGATERILNKIKL